MIDLALGGLWLGVLAGGLLACVLVRALGLAATYVRDLLHIGAGVWILGLPHWHGPAVPIALTLVVAVTTAAMPRLAAYNALAVRIVHSVSNREEQWTGLVYYTLAYALFTALAVTLDPFPAAAALLALSLGDGIGGAVGRRFGRHRFQMPEAKVKSVEGSLAVLVAASAGAWFAAAVLGREVSAAAILLLGVVASLVEALSPRATDNVLIPIAVWTAATLVT